MEPGEMIDHLRRDALSDFGHSVVTSYNGLEHSNSRAARLLGLWRACWNLGRGHLNGRNKPKALAAHCLDVSRLLGVVLQRGTQIMHVLADQVRGDIQAGPDFVEKYLRRNDIALVAPQAGQHGGGLRRELNDLFRTDQPPVIFREKPIRHAQAPSPFWSEPRVFSGDRVKRIRLRVKNFISTDGLWLSGRRVGEQAKRGQCLLRHGDILFRATE